MLIDDEKLLAWLDGELSTAESAEVAAVVAADPELTALAEAHRAVAARLQTGFAPLLTAPIPAQMAEAVQSVAASTTGAMVTDLAAVRAARAAPVRRALFPQWAAIAATLVIGVVAGRTSTGFGPTPALVDNAGGLVASGSLATALDAQLASAPANARTKASGDVRVIVSFRGQDRRICRTWSTAGQEGIACRQGSSWRIVAAFSKARTREADYRMAGDNNPQLLATLDAMIAGEPFDRAQEQAAKDRGWQ